MKVAGTTSVLTLLIVLAFTSEGRSQEQFHDARFLDQLDQDIMKEEEIKPVQPKETFKERDIKESERKETEPRSDPKDGDSSISKRGKMVVPCFQHRRESVLVPVVEKYSKIEKMQQQVDCADASFKNIKINEKGCYIEIFYNVPARRTVSRLQYRFKKVCCDGYKGADCNRQGNDEDDASDDMERLEFQDVSSKESVRLYNGIGDATYDPDHIVMCNKKGVCFCKQGWEGPTCDTAKCKRKCHNGGKCVRPDECLCPSGFAGATCKEAVCLKACLNGGRCMEGKCSCELNWEGDQCQTPICRTPCQHGTCDKPNTCNCEKGWTGASCEQAICKLACKNGGKCVSPDHCVCTKGYQGMDCSFPFCSRGCGAEGQCIGPEKCMCGQGRSGPSCETVAPTETPGGGGKIEDDSKTCAVSSNAFFKTFDDKFFYFPGKCTYQVAGDCIGQSFAVHISIDPTCSSLYNKPCKRIVQLFLRSDLNVKISTNGVFLNNVNQSLPFSFKNVVVKKVGYFVIVEGWKGLKIRWDGHDGVYITMSPEHRNKTCGLCGNYDGVKENDFATFQGRVTQDVAAFGNSWARTKVDEKCPNVFKKDLDSVYGKLRYHEAKQVDAICDPLYNAKEFEKCRKTVNVEPYFTQCREEVAKCDSATRSQCVCNTFTQYSRACARASVALNWRTSSLCPADCKNGHVHNECGTSCPKTCHNLLHHSACKQTCVDGCFCPPGLVSNGTHCIDEYRCTCMHEKKIYKSGESFNKDCNKCYCTRGRWKCTERDCPGTCTVFGKHIKTYDGKWYDFNSVCKYILSKDVNQLFTVILENVRCSRMNYMVDSCAKSLRVRLNGTEIKLKRDFNVQVDHVRVSLPYHGPGVTIKEVSSCFLRLHASIGLDILYDRYGQKVLVTVQSKFLNKTLGLCGTFDRKQEDDYMTSDGNIDNNVHTFGKSWKLDPRCKESEVVPPDPCDSQPQRAPIAEKKCNKLMMEPFAKCHKVLSPEKFIKLCKDDVCSCADGKECLCEVIATYVHECALLGVTIDWRNEDILPECAVKCPANQVHQECGSLCKRTCRDLGSTAKCEDECIPGCNCPNGTVMNDLGSCVVPSECTCHVDGNTHNPDDVVYKDKCTSCVCINGQFNCSSIDKCGRTCPGNQVWTDKKVSCFKTCENVHLPCLASINPVGCHCPGHTVWDENSLQCVEETQCPCHHNGKSYYHGESYKTDCNTCTCRNSKWRCTTFPCTGTCSVYGDPHYTTFDGKKFHFEGRCKYILSEDHCGSKGSFRIMAENVACGTTGATCSKSVTIVIKDTRIVLQRGERIQMTPAQPGLLMKENIVMIKTTFFDIIHAKDAGISIMWDRGTRLLVSLNATHSGKTCGLCGNFNGNQEDDFTSPEGDVGVTPEVFGDSYKVDDSCPDTKPPVHPCDAKKYRASWAHKQCSIINSDLFKECHKVVDQKPYYDACYYDTCGCDMGGDCECLCTAVAAYAQVCNLHGVHVKWRTQEFCPIQCQTCDIYKACGTSHPETCENRCSKRATLPIKCVEGCFCPNGTIRSKDGKCVKPEECQCTKDGVVYPSGARVEGINKRGCIESCMCKSGCLECTIKPGSCPTPTTMTSTTSTSTSTTTSTTTSTSTTSTTTSTTASTTPSCTGPHKHKCKDGKCIDAKKICDKHCDCTDCTDEQHCPPITCPPCKDFQCHGSCKCISQKFVCDQHCDCPNCTDETGCTTTQTLTTTAKTTTATPTPCPYPLTWRCVNDCDGDCHHLAQKKTCDKNKPCHYKCACPPGLYQNGTHCVPSSSCGCLVDLPPLTLVPPGKTWERDCTVYTCFNNTVTTSPKSCPKPHCPHGKLVVRAGECCPVCECYNCTTPTPPTCWPGEHRCVYKGHQKCIPKSWICDGETDCDCNTNCNGKVFCDECNCPTTKPPCSDRLLPNVPDDHFTASSSVDIYLRPSNARINPKSTIKHDGGAWCAKPTQTGSEWIQVDLGSRMEITKVGTKGKFMTSRYVVHYRILYSSNGYSWEVYKENGKDKWFDGNTQSDVEVKNKLANSIKARYIRLKIESYYGAACLRMELYGCGAPITTTPTGTTTQSTTKCPEFLCEDGKCIPHRKVCDGVIDCKGDETHCNHTCSTTQFKCIEDGKCISKAFVCDGDPDCRNGTDEWNCTTTCPPTSFRCDDGRCINQSSLCDRVCDCRHCEDEHSHNCTTTTTTATTTSTTPTTTSTTTEWHPPTTTSTVPTTTRKSTTTSTEGTTSTASTKGITFETTTPQKSSTSTTPTKPTTTKPTTKSTTETTKQTTTEIITYSETTPRGQGHGYNKTTPWTTTEATTTPKTTTTASTTTTQTTTKCPPKSTCICEVSCESLANDRKGCIKKTCIDGCECPTNYKRDNVTGYCVEDMHCMCIHKGRIVPPGKTIFKDPCQQCICKSKGLECVKYCNITRCPKGQELKHYKGDKCCECVNKTCPGERTHVTCGCQKYCPALQNGTLVCNRQTCKETCLCPDGKYDNGTACVKSRDCQCIDKGIVRKPGSHWSSGKCQDCKCVDGKVTCGKVCKIHACPTGYKLEIPDGDHECCYCKETITTTQSTTTASTTPTTTASTTTSTTTASTTPASTTPMAVCSTVTKKDHYVDKQGCKTEYPIDKTKCVGQCHSETTSDIGKLTATSDCKCCKPFEYRTTSVKLRCPDGTTKSHKYYVFKSCRCYGCSANPFGDDLHIESSDEYALRR